MCRPASALALVVLASSGLASAASAGQQRTAAPLAPEAAPVRSAPAAQRTLRGAAAELRAKAVSLLRWMQAPKEEIERQAKDAKEAADASSEGLTGYFLLSGWEIVINVVVGLLLLILFGYLYKEHKYTHMMDAGWDENMGGASTLDNEWKYAFWDCFATPKMCFIACCCPAIRWADSMDMANQLSFWVAVSMWWVVSLFNLYVGFLFAFVSGILGAIYRQKIRAIFKIESGTPKTIALDFFAYCCCPCVPIVQEGRTLEAAKKTDHQGVRDGFMEKP